MTKSGKNIGLYLSEEIYGHIARDARARGIPVTTWVRNVVLAALPPDLRPEQAVAKRQTKRRRPGKAARQPVNQLGVGSAANPDRQAVMRTAPKDTPAQSLAGKQEPGSFAALVERHRDRVLDLEARGHLPNAICSITRLEYRVIAQILSTKATRKEPRR
jgi:hypothetical protein